MSVLSEVGSSCIPLDLFIDSILVFSVVFAKETPSESLRVFLEVGCAEALLDAGLRLETSLKVSLSLSSLSRLSYISILLSSKSSSSSSWLPINDFRLSSSVSCPSVKWLWEFNNLLVDAWIRDFAAEGAEERMLWAAEDVTVAVVNEEDKVVLRELVVNNGLLKPNPFTSPLWENEPNEPGRLGGNVKPPRPKGLYKSPGGYKKGKDEEGNEEAELMLAAVVDEDAGAFLRDEELPVSLSLRLFSESLWSFDEGKLLVPSGDDPWSPGKLNPGKPNNGFVKPIPAKPPKGKNIGWFAEVVEVDVVVLELVLDFEGSMKNFILGKPLSIPVLAKLRGFKPAVEGKDMVVTGGTKFWWALASNEAAVRRPLFSDGVTILFDKVFGRLP